MPVAFALVGVAVLTQSGALRSMAFLSALIAILAASSFVGYGVVDAWQERRSRGQRSAGRSYATTPAVYPV